MDGPTSQMAWHDLAARIGSSFGPSPWMTVTQSMIDEFADATDDHYFLHVDPERAAGTPFGRTIAHGLLTLSLLPAMAYQACPYVDGARYPLNYGFNKVRFVAPVSVGSRLRGHFLLKEAQIVSSDQRQLLYGAIIEVDGQPRPALAAEWLMRYVF